MVTMASHQAPRETRSKQETTNARLLGWLLAYPASSAPELASAFGLHPATVYRYLGRMRTAGWLERVTGYGGEARFLLTPGGTARLAQALHQDVDQLARAWQRGQNAPARLLPRLLSIDRLHIFACHFFQHAPTALARQGRPVLVRWHLTRDWRSCLQAASGGVIRLQAPALLAWTLTGSRQDACSLWATEARGPTEETRWHCAFLLLESGLCDAALITARLRAWLRYRTWLERECASPTSSFAPVLVLVQNERQVQVWRLAAHEAARRQNAAPLAGAIAIIGKQENPWQWAWRDLTTGAHLRLASCFASLVPGSLPEGALAHLRAVQALLHACGQSDEVTLLKPAAQPGSRKGGGEQQASLATGSQAFSPRQREVLTQLARTPYLTAEEIAAVLPRLDGEPLAASSAGRFLRDLARQGLAQRDLVVQEPQALWRWHLSEQGLCQVASMHEVSLRHLRRQAERSRFVMSRQATHQAGVYAVIAAFHQTAQARGTITIRWWESGRGAERSYHYHGVQRNLRPDAELELALRAKEGDIRRLRLWLEYDTGSMNRRDLERKMTSYRDYWNSREWAVEGLAAFPRLLFIVPEQGQEDRVRAACCAMLSGVRLHVLVTTAAHLQTSTPGGPIWRQLWPPLPEREQASRRRWWE
jgi:DNA-binding MarR family transcriptional regulator